MKKKSRKIHGLRTCLVCRKRFAKELLKRYVWDQEDGAAIVDKMKLMPGRGVYCCLEGNCEEQFLKRKQGWKRAFRLG